MTTHNLKTDVDCFAATVTGVKPFEVRKNDRDFQVGDVLNLQEWDPDVSAYTGQEAEVKVRYILEGGQYGIEPGYVVMSVWFVD